MNQVLVVLAIAAIFPPSLSQTTVASSSITEQAKLTASDGAPDDFFGISVSLSGDTALVGAPHDDDNGLDSGSAYVFVQSGSSWSEEAKLTASDGFENDNFGSAVSLFGDTALVGAYGHGDLGNDSGSVYVFVESGTSWTEEAKLMASDGAEGDLFGVSVSLSGDTALAGAYHDDDNGLDSGSAYVFVRSGSGWREEAKLTASDGSAGDWFGISVSLYGDTALVGAEGDDGFEGSAYVFLRSGSSWTEEAKLTASAGPGSSLGSRVALSSDTALIAAYGEDNFNGSAYVFVRSGMGWTEQAKLTLSDGQQAVFGSSVALFGNRALVGAYAVNDFRGSAFVFARSGSSWTGESKLMASDGVAGAGLGLSVALVDDTALVGAYGDDDNGAFSGSAYVFVLPPAPSVYCTAGVSASGCQALLSASGSASATAPSGFTLSASTVEGQKDGLFFFGTNGQQANPWGNGTSYQCVVPPVVRTQLLSGTGTNGSCDGALSLDMNAVWTNQPAKNPGAGATVQAQLWYRDPLSTSNQTTSLSDAIEFVVQP